MILGIVNVAISPKIAKLINNSAKVKPMSRVFTITKGFLLDYMEYR